MVQTVKTENGSSYSFPDDATPEQISAAMEKYADTNDGQNKEGFSLGGALKSAKGTISDVLAKGKETAEGVLEGISREKLGDVEGKQDTIKGLVNSGRLASPGIEILSYIPSTINPFKKGPKIGEAVYTSTHPVSSAKKGLARFALSASDNPREEKAFLEKIYGAGNVGQDDDGTWWFLENGNKKPIQDTGIGGFLDKTLLGITATSPELAGMGIGAAQGARLGAMGGPWGVGLGGLVGAGAGALGGRNIEELLKASLIGVQKTPEEMRNAQLESFVAGSIGQMLPSVLGRAWAGIKNIPHRLANISPEMGAKILRALESGYRVPFTSLGTSMKAMEAEAKLAASVVGAPWEKKNAEMVEKNLTKILEELGDKSPFQTLRSMYDQHFKLGPEKANQAVVEAAQGILHGLEKKADASLVWAREVSREQLGPFQKMAENVEGFSEAVPQQIKLAEQKIKQAFKGAYDDLDRLGDLPHPIVNTSFLKSAALRVLKENPIARVPSEIKEILRLNNLVSFKQMRAIRGHLREMASDGSALLSAPEKRLFSDLASHANESLMSLEEKLADTPLKSLIPKLKETDSQYAEAIAPFKERELERLVQRAKSGLSPDPEKVLDIIAERGYDARARFVVSTMDEKTRGLFTNALLKREFTEALKFSSDTSEGLSGKQLLSSYKERGSLLKEELDRQYGSGFAHSYERAIKDIAALDGKLDIKRLEELLPNMTPGRVLDFLQDRLATLKSIDEFTKRNPIGALATTNPEVKDAAIRNLLNTEGSATLQSARDTLGENSQAWREIREYAIKDIFSRSLGTTEKGWKIILGENLHRASQRYTKEQQEILFPSVKELKNGTWVTTKESLLSKVQRIAEDTSLVFPGSYVDDLGQSLAAANIKLNVPFHINAVRRWIISQGIARLLSSPRTTEFLVKGIQNPTIADRVVLQTIGEKVLGSAVAEAIRGKL